MKRNALLLCLIIALVAGCGRSGRARRPAQELPLTSPSGEYVLTMPIENDRAQGNAAYRRLKILDSDGNVVYKDKNPPFWSARRIYWAWDQEDRVWLYNGFDTTVWFWEQSDGAWTKNKYGYGRAKQIDREIAPPEKLYPDYTMILPVEGGDGIPPGVVVEFTPKKAEYFLGEAIYVRFSVRNGSKHEIRFATGGDYRLSTRPLRFKFRAWDEAGKNPDGTRNKFKKPLLDFPKIGHIGLQDHGQPVWFRNVRIRPVH